MEFRFSFIRDTLPEVVKAIPITMLLTFLPAVLGAVLGFALALILIRRIPVLSQIVKLLSSFFRCMPIMILLFLGYYGIPKVINFLLHDGMRVLSPNRMNSTTIAVITLTIYSAFFICEIFRGALSSVDLKQMEAAHSVGMTKLSAYSRIILPQAVIMVMPNYFNFILTLLKGTSVVFVIKVMDIMARAKLSAETGYRFIEAYTMIGTMYVIFSVVLSKSFRMIERRAKRHVGESV